MVQLLVEVRVKSWLKQEVISWVKKSSGVISTSYAVMEAYLKLRHVLVNRNESRRKLFLTVLKVCYPISLTDFSHKVSNKIST